MTYCNCLTVTMQPSMLLVAFYCQEIKSLLTCLLIRWRRSYGGLGHVPSPSTSNNLFSLLWSKCDSQLSAYCVVCKISWCRCQQLTALSISTALVIEQLLHPAMKSAVSALWPNFHLCPSSQQILATPLYLSVCFKVIIMILLTVRTLCVSASLTTTARRSICRMTFIAHTPVDPSMSLSLSITSLALTRPWSAVTLNVARWSTLYVVGVCSLVSTPACTCTPEIRYQCHINPPVISSRIPAEILFHDYMPPQITLPVYLLVKISH